MRIGFTGTREGMTPRQILALNKLLQNLDVALFHHGCCVGADDDAVLSCLAFTLARVVAHPSNINSMTSGRALAKSDASWERKPPLERNRDIVSECEYLIACPKEYEEQDRGGTWHTVRCAREKGVEVHIIWPDGTSKIEEKRI